MKALSLFAALVLPVAIGAAQTCGFPTFGRPCGGDLAGSQLRTAAGLGIQLDVTNAAPGSIAVLVIGQEMRPVQLPGSNCTLIVDPRATLVQQVGRRGHTTFQLRLPPIAPLAVDFQVVTVALNRNGRTAESTNAVAMHCR